MTMTVSLTSPMAKRFEAQALAWQRQNGIEAHAHAQERAFQSAFLSRQQEILSRRAADAEYHRRQREIEVARLQIAQEEFVTTRAPWRKIVYAICKKHNVRIKRLLSTNRSIGTIPCRHDCMYELNKTGNYTLEQIGRFLGRHHSSVMHGVRRHKRLIGEPHVPFLNPAQLRLFDALREAGPRGLSAAEMVPTFYPPKCKRAARPDDGIRKSLGRAIPILALMGHEVRHDPPGRYTYIQPRLAEDAERRPQAAILQEGAP